MGFLKRKDHKETMGFLKMGFLKRKDHKETMGFLKMGFLKMGFLKRKDHKETMGFLNYVPFISGSLILITFLVGLHETGLSLN